MLLKGSSQLACSLFQNIVERASDGIIVVDGSGYVVLCNPAVAQLFQRCREELQGDLFGFPIAAGEMTEITILRQDGLQVVAEMRVSEAYWEQERVYIALLRDVTKVKENEERLRVLAHFDALTGLPNRFLFQDHAGLALAQATRTGKQVAVMFLDLDRFKVINDTLGHRAGDDLLIEVARRLSGCLRAGDTLSRFGGDEFNAVLPNLDSGGIAARVADKFIEALAHPFHIAGKDIHVTTSIGIAIYPHDGNQLDQLSRAADAAMYQAKEQGRNTYCFYEEDGRDEALSRRFLLENHLRHALDRGEISVVYQPEVDIESGEVRGMEALLRWQHPEMGAIAPAEFIPLAEEIGIISRLGAWVLRAACLQNKAWQDMGYAPMWIAVNLAPSQLRDRHLVDSVAAILDETGLEGHWLEFELTEGALMQNIEESITILDALKQLGVRLSIDDFGTGHSSLAYLRRLPVDTLKIDRSLVANIATNEGDAAISRTIVSLAHNLDLRVVAEGIESAEQFGMLREFQCCDAQGYYFSHPLPPEQITALLGTHELRRHFAAPSHSNDLSTTGATL